MTTPRLLFIILLPVLLFSCSKKESASKLKTIPISEIGVTIDAPEDWVLTKNMDRYYGLKGPKGQQVQIIGSKLFGGASLDDLAKECRETVLEKEMLPGGAYYVLCKGEQAGRETKAVKVNLSTGENSSVRCEWETDQDPAPLAKICKTLKKN